MQNRRRTANLPGVSTKEGTTSAMPFQMCRFSPVVKSSGTGTVNFVVNICPTDNIDIKSPTEVKSDMTT